jgi:hypothetical protein
MDSSWHAIVPARVAAPEIWFNAKVGTERSRQTLTFRRHGSSLRKGATTVPPNRKRVAQAACLSLPLVLLLHCSANRERAAATTTGPAPVASAPPTAAVATAPRVDAGAANADAATTVAAPPDVERLRATYDATKAWIDGRRQDLAARYRAATTEQDRSTILTESRALVVQTLSERIIPAWYGTPWTFGGQTRTPGTGSIACGSFVVSTLADAGFRVPASMAAQPSENILKNLIGTKDLRRFPNRAAMDDVIDWVTSQGDGVFVVGLDIHVGYVINAGGHITFRHSSYYKPPLAVVSQDVREQSPLTDSRYRVLGKLFTDEMLTRWLLAQPFPITFDYFKK